MNSLGSKLKLIKCSEKGEMYSNDILEYKKEFIQNNDSMDGCSSLKRAKNIEEYLKTVKSYENKESLPDEKVVSTQFLCIRETDNKIVGMIQVRHYFNEYLKKYAGNIGYSVRPSERQKGYATWMLQNVKPFCKSIGLDKILVCCNESNEGSRKVILNNHGVYESTVYCETENINLERYWIKL